MPYAVREREGKFIVINTDTEEVKGEHDSKEKAIAQMRALYANADKSAKGGEGSGNFGHAGRPGEVGGSAGGGGGRLSKDEKLSRGDRVKLVDENDPDFDVNFEVVEDRGTRVLVVDSGSTYPLKPQFVISKTDLRKKSIDYSYAKSLGLELPDPSILAVKSVGMDTIKGYTFLWGNDKQTDVEREYFTAKTDFWDERLGKSPRPLTWDHAQDDEFKATPVIGTITEWGDDDLGRWYEAKLDRSHKYRKMIDKLIEEGVLGTSSDSAPQYVVREKTGKATWLKQWPWFASALTDVPAEPRMIGSLEFLKSLGVLLPDPENDKSRWEWERARIQLLKLNR